MEAISLRQIQNRHQMVRFFDGYAGRRMEELDERKLKGPLVKTYLIELLNGQQTPTAEALKSIFQMRGLPLECIDDELFLATDGNGREIGFVERLRPRIVALYSTMEAKDLDNCVRHLVLGSPEIDYVWLSGLTFNVLWELVARLCQPNRFGRLAFTHDSIFDIDGTSQELEEDEEELAQDSENHELEKVVEQRAASFRLVDRVGVIRDKLSRLQELYSPLYAINQLRFPSPVGRGGHDFYDNGRITNRSESFRDHRSHALFVVRIYERLLRSTEEQSWYSIKDSVGIPGQFRKIVGAPVVIRFREHLSAGTFNQWVSATFERKRNRFRLWGHPIRLGPTKVHVYGVDRHLWQPLFLELTSKGCIAIIPNGTCGNTVHRLVTNIQRYLDPGAEAFVGNKSYRDMVKESSQGVPYEFDSE